MNEAFKAGMDFPPFPNDNVHDDAEGANASLRR